MSPDNEVIERSAREPAVFAALFDRHAVSVYRYVAQRLGDHVADDVMSETFLVAFEKRSSYNLEVADARPWLLGIATRLMRKYARLEAVAWRGLAADLAAQVAPDFVEQVGSRVDDERLTRRLSKALQSLSAADRDTFLLFAWGELSYASIAEAMQVPVGTVRSRLNRTRRRLRRAAGFSILDQETDHGRTDTVQHHL